MSARNLTATWLQNRQRHGMTRAAAIEQLNRLTSRRYTRHRISEWLSGRRNPDRETRAMMLAFVLPDYGVAVKHADDLT